jgi:hypothetical protein
MFYSCYMRTESQITRKSANKVDLYLKSITSLDWLPGEATDPLLQQWLDFEAEQFHAERQL